jgi:hypothetical protein
VWDPKTLSIFLKMYSFEKIRKVLNSEYLEEFRDGASGGE